MSQGIALLELLDSGDDAQMLEHTRIREHVRELARSLGPRSAEALRQIEQAEAAWFDLRTQARHAEMRASIDGEKYPSALRMSVEEAHWGAARVYRQSMAYIDEHHLPTLRKALIATVDSECAEVKL